MNSPFFCALRVLSFLGDVVCALLGCQGVRLYHDNCLSRAPGSKHTRWHCDDGPGCYMAMKPSSDCAHLHPGEGQQAVTVWYPLQAGTGPEKGSLVFASLPTVSEEDGQQPRRCINAFDVAAMEGCPAAEQSDEYDSFVTEVLESRGCSLSAASYELGDVSIHYTNCFHCSGPNTTPSPRMIMGVTYFADGTLMRHLPEQKNGEEAQELPAAYKKFCPGCPPGEVIATKLNPLLPHCSGP